MGWVVGGRLLMQVWRSFIPFLRVLGNGSEKCKQLESSGFSLSLSLSLSLTGFPFGVSFKESRGFERKSQERYEGVREGKEE